MKTYNAPPPHIQDIIKSIAVLAAYFMYYPVAHDEANQQQALGLGLVLMRFMGVQEGYEKRVESERRLASEYSRKAVLHTRGLVEELFLKPSTRFPGLRGKDPFYRPAIRAAFGITKAALAIAQEAKEGEEIEQIIRSSIALELRGLLDSQDAPISNPVVADQADILARQVINLNLYPALLRFGHGIKCEQTTPPVVRNESEMVGEKYRAEWKAWDLQRKAVDLPSGPSNAVSYTILTFSHSIVSAVVNILQAAAENQRPSQSLRRGMQKQPR